MYDGVRATQNHHKGLNRYGSLIPDSHELNTFN